VPGADGVPVSFAASCAVLLRAQGKFTVVVRDPELGVELSRMVNDRLAEIAVVGAPARRLIAAALEVLE